MNRTRLANQFVGHRLGNFLLNISAQEFFFKNFCRGYLGKIIKHSVQIISPLL